MSSFQTIYLLGWEVELNGDETCEYFIRTHSLSEEFAKEFGYRKALLFQDGILDKVYEFNARGLEVEYELKSTERNFPFIETVPNEIYMMEESISSDSYLGGEIPITLTMPSLTLKAPMLYLGRISKKSDGFEWLPFDIELMTPSYLSFSKLFMDYTNPNAPKIINEEEMLNAQNQFVDLKPDSEIIYSKKFIELYVNQNRSKIGVAGIPIWVQYPAIPKCPKSGKMMKFLCQLSSENQVEVSRSNINPSVRNAAHFQKMNFWIDGELFVFFEPESKVACYLIQNT